MPRTGCASRLEQAVAGLRRRVQPPGGPGQEGGGDRVGGVEGRALRGQALRGIRGALPGRAGPRVLDRHSRARERGDDHHCGEPGQGLPAPPAASRGPAAGPQELRLAGAQRGVPARVPGPDARGLPGGGQLDVAVQQRAVAAAGPPPRRVLGELAVQDHAGLVFGQPPPQPRPGPEQDVVRDLGAVGVQRDQAVPGERLQDRADLGPLRRGRPGAQVAGADRPAGRPAVRPGAGQPAEDLPGDGLLVLGQAAVGRLGADLHGPGDPGPGTSVQVRLPGQLVALAVLPGRGHGLGQQRQDRAARRLLPGRAQVGQDGIGQARLDGQPARLGRAGDHAAQLSFGHRPGDDLVAFHERDELGVGRAPVPVVAAYRDDREQRGLCARGRPAGSRPRARRRRTRPAQAWPRRPRPRRPARTGR